MTRVLNGKIPYKLFYACLWVEPPFFFYWRRVAQNIMSRNKPIKFLDELKPLPGTAEGMDRIRSSLPQLGENMLQAWCSHTQRLRAGKGENSLSILEIDNFCGEWDMST